MRMGINTGFCNVGNFGSDDRMDYTIIGAEANLAARLQSIAEPGGIVLSYETYMLVRDMVRARALEPITLKGIPQPVVPYAVEGSIAARHGFEVVRDPVEPSPWQRVHLFGQNILFGLLMLACHSGRARPRKISRSRQVIYLARGALDCKHIAAARGHNQAMCVGEQQKDLLWPREAEAPSTV